MPGDSGWVAMALPNGKRMLVNMDMTFCFTEEDNGMAIAVSIAGTKVNTGEKFETILADMSPVS